MSIGLRLIAALGGVFLAIALIVIAILFVLSRIASDSRPEGEDWW